MTGWRVGWMVVPEPLVRTIDRLQGNLAIVGADLHKSHAEAAFDGRAENGSGQARYEENLPHSHRGIAENRLDKFLRSTARFYLYADISKFPTTVWSSPSAC